MIVANVVVNVVVHVVVNTVVNDVANDVDYGEVNAVDVAKSVANAE